MEFFKRVLKVALSQRAVKIVFPIDDQPYFETTTGLESLNEEPLVTLEMITLLFKKLFMVEFSQVNDTPLKAKLNVINFGVLKLIGVPRDNGYIALYVPPSGEALYNQDWKFLQEEATNAAAATRESLDLPRITHPHQQHQVSNSSGPQFFPPGTTDAHTPPPVKNIKADLEKFSMDPPEDEMFASNPVSKHEETKPEQLIEDSEMTQNPPESPKVFDNSLPFPIDNKIEDKTFLESTNSQETTSKPELISEPQIPLSSDEQSEENFHNVFSLGGTNDENENLPEVRVEPPDISGSATGENIQSLDRHSLTEEGEENLMGFSSHEQPLIQNETASADPPRSQAIVYANDMDDEKTGKETHAIDKILKQMVEKGASDVHLSVGEPISFRIDGEINRINEEKITPPLMASILDPIIPKNNHREFIETNDTDFAYESTGIGRFRVNLFRSMRGVGSVFRFIPSKIPTADDLELPDAIRKFCHLNKGLVIVTGPTGSGKSTTLAAMIDLINKNRRDHILTIEDPVEFLHKQQQCLINQRELFRHTGSFSRALKAALREDPDIVLIGELRDLETMAIAIETAETGHLVFGTLHTNTAISTIDRIIDQFPGEQQQQIRAMLSESLKGVIAQTLIKKKKGGRVAAHEILIANKAVSSMIREGKTHMIANQMQTQKNAGNLLLNESLLKLVAAGIIDPLQAYLKAVDKEVLLATLQQKNLAGDIVKEISA